MDKITIKVEKAHIVAKEICEKVYNLSPDEYRTKRGEDDNTVDIIFTCSGRKSNARIVFDTDDGDYTGFLSLFPPLNDGENVSLEEVMELLKSEDIKNLDNELISILYNKFTRGEVVYKEIVARGIRLIETVPPEIIIHFKSVDKKPKIKDGKVDFKDVGNIITVEKGEPLITKKPGRPGVRGVNIHGKVIEPEDVKDITIYPGSGVKLNETGTIFFADTDGYVDFDGKKLGVYPIYLVKGNVDYSVGNIKFNGCVHVKGDVLSGFKIEASKDVIVDGICQDCNITAGGSIDIKVGIKGSGENLIKAGGDINIGYVEGAKIYSKQSVYIKKYAFNSEIYAGDKIEAVKGEGIIAGGVIKACSEISIKQLGTSGNSKFDVILGYNYYIEEELDKIKAEKERIIETLKKIDDVLKPFNLRKPIIANNPKIKKMIEVRDGLKNLLTDLSDKEEKLTKKGKAKSPKLKVKNKVFEGATITIYNTFIKVRDSRENVVFYYDNKFNEVSAISLKDVNKLELEDEQGAE